MILSPPVTDSRLPGRGHPWSRPGETIPAFGPSATGAPGLRASLQAILLPDHSASRASDAVPGGGRRRQPQDRIEPGTRLVEPEIRTGPCPCALAERAAESSVGDETAERVSQLGWIIAIDDKAALVAPEVVRDEGPGRGVHQDWPACGQVFPHLSGRR